MPQIHFYVPEAVAVKIKQRAEAAGLNTSRYVAELVKREVSTAWPAGFFEEVVGGWQGEPLQRPTQGQFEAREAIRDSKQIG